MLRLKEIVDGLAKAITVRLFRHVLRRDDDSILTFFLDLEVNGKKKRRQPKKTQKKQVNEEMEKIGLMKDDALNQAMWQNKVQKL